jgi:hypothetical protein
MFPGHVTPLPERPGVYEREIGGHWRYAYWSGHAWYQSALTVEMAAAAKNPAGTTSNNRWRGLAEPHVPVTVDYDNDCAP